MLRIKCRSYYVRDVYEYLQFIIQATNMSCLTPKSALEGDCGFLSANLYAKSVFGLQFCIYSITLKGEDALGNVSVESDNGKISGFIRIRSKTQGIALSLGEKITIKQKTTQNIPATPTPSTSTIAPEAPVQQPAPAAVEEKHEVEQKI